MYIRRVKAMYTKFAFSTVRLVAEEQALLDSGASENFIDEETWKTLGIGTFTLPKPVTIYNVDGTENKQGKITRYCWLKVKRGKQEHRMRFFLTALGKDRFIFGYPFLYAFNPQVDWKEGRMLGPETEIQTIGFKRAHRLLRRTQLRAIRACGTWPKKGEAIYYRRATTSQDMAHKWQRRQGKAPPDELPEEYK